jgi:hypothetical protein
MPVGWSLHRDGRREEKACRDRAAARPASAAAPQCPSFDARGFPETATGWASKVLGLLITWLALTVGGPIWFDLLGRLVNMRNTGPKPKASTKPSNGA